MHETDQSFALKKFYDWSHSIYVTFEEDKEIQITKLLELTEKEVISSTNAKCIDDENYKPDDEMTALITRKVKCNLPWSNLKMNQFEDCETEEEFENYLNGIIKEQDAIERIPIKCQYKIWSLTHWGERSRDLESASSVASVNVDLLFTKGQVWTLEFFKS